MNVRARRFHGILGAAIAVTVCLRVASPTGAQTDPATHPLGLLDQAAAYERAGNPRAAIEAYASFLDHQPNDRLAPVAAYATANLRCQALRDTIGAIRAYDRVVRQYPTSDLAAEAARRKAECLQGRKQWVDAGEAYAQALTLAGQGSAAAAPSTDWINEVSLGVADCFYQSGDPRRVIEAYEDALEGPMAPQPAATALYRLGDAYEKIGEPERAAICYARIVEDYPFAGVFDAAVGKRELIRGHRALEWTPYLIYARTSGDFARRDFAAVPARCDSILALSQNAPLRACAAYRKIVAETQTGGDFTGARQRLSALLDSLPDPRTMPNARQQLERYETMAEAEQRAAENPNDAGSQTALGGLYLQLGLVTRAAEVLERAVALAPDDAETRLYYGYACNATGRPEPAMAAFQFYLERNPSDTNAINQIGYALLQQGDAARAIPYFRRLVELTPDDPNAHDSLGEGLLNAGQLPEAAAEYERALELDPTFANSRFMLGEVYRRLDDAPKAIAAYRRFLEQTPEGPQTDAARAALEQLEAR
jgi:tetratricopeptide (TPR) repeat protein